MRWRTIGPQRGPASGGVPLRQRGANGLAHVLGVTAMAPERWPQERHAGWRLAPQSPQDWVHVRPMIPAVPSGEVDALGFGRFGAVVASIDLHAYALQRAHAGHQTQGLSRGLSALRR